MPVEAELLDLCTSYLGVAVIIILAAGHPFWPAVPEVVRTRVNFRLVNKRKG